MSCGNILQQSTRKTQNFKGWMNLYSPDGGLLDLAPHHSNHLFNSGAKYAVPYAIQLHQDLSATRLYHALSILSTMNVSSMIWSC
eukprot:174001-Ditylum_brightwellii.AAC.1